MYNHKNGVTLRKAESTDLDALLLLKQESWWGTHGSAILNTDDQVRWFQNIPNDCIVLVGEIANDDDKNWVKSSFLGVCIISAIDWIARTADISGAVAKDNRSPELSRKAFEAGLDFAFEMLNLRRLNAEVTEYNYPAQRIEIDHLGFTIEGVKRANVFKSGRYYNSLVLGVLDIEWKKTERMCNIGGCCNQNFDHDIATKMIDRSKRKYNWEMSHKKDGR